MPITVSANVEPVPCGVRSFALPGEKRTISSLEPAVPESPTSRDVIAAIRTS